MAGGAGAGKGSGLHPDDRAGAAERTTQHVLMRDAYVLPDTEGDLRAAGAEP